MTSGIRTSTSPIDAGMGKLPRAEGRTSRPMHLLLEHLLSSLSRGCLHVRLPNGQSLTAQGAEGGPEATLILHRWRPLIRMVLRGDIGFAESYRDGDWSSPDLTALLSLGILNESAWAETLSVRWPLNLLLRLGHRRRDNDERGSRRNIAFHYDLGNAFYEQWLDEDLIYSSGIFRQETDSLEAAQANKLAAVLDLLQLPDTPCQVLEVGCGWGALACCIASRSPASVAGITLSTEQLAHAQARAAREGLAERLDLRLQDYRHVQGSFDRIVSVEMVEAVGERHWPTYFATLRDRLRPGGHAVIQSITIGDAYFDHYRENVDFIQRFIFPGGMLPSPGALAREAKRAGLAFEVAETFGKSYAATLVEWRRRFHAAWPEIRALGFDDAFGRLWDYYLSYCEAGFLSGRVDVGLYVLRRPG